MPTAAKYRSWTCSCVSVLLTLQACIGCSGSSDNTGTGSTAAAGAGGNGAVAAGGASMGGGAVGSASGGRATATGAGGMAGAGGVAVVGGSGGASAGGAQAGGAGGHASGGAAGAGGRSSTGGSSGTGGSSSASCGGTAVTLNPNPFGCKFAWGASPNGSLASYGYLGFATYWIESAIKADGSFSTCSGCNWLKSNFGSGSIVPVYYAYIIGYMGHAAGLEDGNTCPAGQPNCPNLTNQGAALVKNNRAKIVAAYAAYAEQTHAVWPTKPLVWLLEGDFVQLNATTQSQPMTMAEVGSLAADITCAIKSKMPNAVVAMNHSNWNSDQVTNDYWNAMKTIPYDMVWTTGVANNNGFIATGTNAKSYNGKTATYDYVHKLTGKTIWVDDSCGVSAMADSWSTSSAATLNGLIGSGVIAFSHCGAPSANYQSLTSALTSQLNSTCP